MLPKKIYTAARLFTGKEWLEGHAVITENGTIREILPVSSLNSSQTVQQFDNCFIAPSFIDLQIYGASEQLFAVFPTTEALKKLVEYCRQGGAAYCLPTVATNEKQVFLKCIDAIREYWKEGGEGVLGIHLEGPWINKDKKGAHVESLIHSPTLEEVSELINYGEGVIRIVTLAPEVCSREIIELLLSKGIRVSAGHSNASYLQARKGFDNGISLVTHLFNAMSPFLHREPGLAGAAMDDARVMASIIPDGHHVDYAAIRVAKKAMGERLFVITDAVTATSEGYYKHRPSEDKYESGGILSGSALNMNKAIQNLVRNGIELEEALRMCSLYPALAIGMDMNFGTLSVGNHSDMVVMDNELQIVLSIN